MKEETNQCNNTIDMKYHQINFNMTVAKRISDGSVLGRVVAISNNVDFGRAIWAYDNPYGNVFTILPSSADTEHQVPYTVCFNNDGKSIGEHDRDKLQLSISIPVEDIYEDGCSKGKDAHYHKCKIEPIDYILANDLGFCEGNIVKYITRYKDKGGIDDLRKIKVYTDYLISELSEKQ